MTSVDVEKIAEAVLYEGYLLFPYRPSSMKNQQRWTFGGVYPRGYSEATGGDDPWLMKTQCLVVGDLETEIEVKVRFLHVVERKVRENGDGAPRFVEDLRVGQQVYRHWEEAIERDLFLGADGEGRRLRLRELLSENRHFAIDVVAGSTAETLLNADNEEVGALVREWHSLEGEVELSAEAVALPESHEPTQTPGMQLVRITVQITNTTPWPRGQDSHIRTDAVRQSLMSTHTILRVRGGEFISLLEPADSFQKAADECENIKTWPVLVGEPGERQIVLSSPIILYDYPQISPESQGNYFDATEIDELLALSVLTLTDEEKQEMRESDDHGREILERTESLSEEQLLKMHGVVRYLQPLREEAHLTSGYPLAEAGRELE
jgi:hypothetical protein